MKTKRVLLNIDTIKKFSSLRTLIIGDLMADKYILGKITRLSTEAPVPVMTVIEDRYELGGAANVANNANKLGATVFLCGVVGYDDAAHNFRNLVKKAGINSGGIFPSSDRPTTQKVRVVSVKYNQNLLRYDYETDIPLNSTDMASIYRYVNSYLSEIDIVILADYEKGILSNPKFNMQLIELANSRNLTSIIYSRAKHLKYFNEAKVIIVTSKDAMQYYELVSGRETLNIDDTGKLITNTINSKTVIIIDENYSIHLYQDNGSIQHLQSDISEFRDVVGIMDVITATASLCIASGANYQETMEIISKAIKVAIKKKGTLTIDLNELLESI
jgi:D-glycero-beta-D-manno-heptose-7-phosphate kinase